MLDRIDPGFHRAAHCRVAVGVRHDGKALVVGDFRELCNEILRHRLVGQNAVVIEIHQPGDHKLDKVSAAFFDLCDKRAEIVDRFKAAPDEAPVVPLAVDGKARRAVGHAVFSRQLAGALSGVPAVAAVSKIRKAERFVRFECSADERLVGRVLVARERVFPVAAVERHMNMTVYCHENPSRPPASADGFIIPTCAEKCKPGA